MNKGYDSGRSALVLEAMDSKPTMRLTEIATAAGIDIRATGSLLAHLQRKGLVSREARGRYTLTEAGRTDRARIAEGVRGATSIRYPVEMYPVSKWLTDTLRGLRRRHGCTALSLDYLQAVWDRQQGRCALSGIPLTTIRGTGYPVPTNALLNRIDPEKGFEPGNLRFLCQEIKTLKGRLSDSELVVLAKLIFTWQSSPELLPELEQTLYAEGEG